MSSDAERILAFRLTGLGLARRNGSVLDAAAGWAIQDSPPGSAAVALDARAAGLAPGELERALEEKRLLATYNPRTALAIVPAGEAAAYLAALNPAEEDELHELVRRAIPEADMGAEAAVALAVEAIREGLDGREVSRDELHEVLRRALPRSLLPWCDGCESHHARRWLLVAACLRGELCIAGRAGRQPAFARPADWLGAPFALAEGDEPARELVRRYLRAYGPSSAALLAQWAGITKAQAKRIWALAEPELAEAGGGWILERDRERFASPEPAKGVRLLPPGDPLLLGRDREALFPDPTRRKRVWTAIGSPGVLLADGRLGGLWRAKKQGKRLALAVEPFGALRTGDRARIEHEAERVASLRGAIGATVSYV